MDNILTRILEHKRDEVACAMLSKPLAQVEEEAVAAAPPRDFVGALRSALAVGAPAVIAEIKRASPSKGLLREHFYPADIARSYEAHGAACLSVLTDAPFFQGHSDYLVQARQATLLPVLRKDFMVEPYQIYESRAMGADCILLIASVLDQGMMADMHDTAKALGMAVLVEVRTATELHRALELDNVLIGINNRDLATFHTDIDTTIRLLQHIPGSCITVSESGISSTADVSHLRAHNVNAFLVGEAFMRSQDPGRALDKLFFQSQVTFHGRTVAAL